MKIIAIDEKKDLFCVENIIPSNLIEQIANLDVTSYNWELQQGQENWKRRKLIPPNHSPLHLIDKHLNEIRPYIADSIGVTFNEYDCWSSFWYDTEGFTTNIHLDGALPNAMQIYLTNCDENLGTVFYYDTSVPWKVRYKFPYKANTGYLMLNNSNQWHAVPTVLKSGQARLSSYTYFGSYNHK